jgi:hypothetical protein
MVLYWIANQWALTKTQVSTSLNIDFGQKNNSNKSPKSKI